MRFETLLLTAATAAAAEPKPLSQAEIAYSIFANPVLLPKSIQQAITERTARFVRRSPVLRRQLNAPPIALPDFGAILGGMFTTRNKPPEATVPQVREVKPIEWPQSIRKRIRYGPFRIPPTSEKNLESELLNVHGMTTTLDFAVKKPCEKECTLLAVAADLEYADGSFANNSNGAWFHHCVLLNAGPTVMEPNCGLPFAEIIFMSGNERTTGGFAIPESKIKSGYNIGTADSFILSTQLMNLDNKEKWVWMTMDYEYLDGPHPDYKQGKTVWMSIGPMPGCPGDFTPDPWGPTNLTLSQQPKSTQFSEHSRLWRAPKDGFILSTGGHMHDGGVNINVFKNKDVICKSVPKYTKGSGGGMGGGGASAGGGGGGMGGHHKRQVMGGNHTNMDIEHIESQNSCLFAEGIPLRKGDTMHIQANYDFNQYRGMKNSKGELDEVMGISGTVVAF